MARTLKEQPLEIRSVSWLSSVVTPRMRVKLTTQKNVSPEVFTVLVLVGEDERPLMERDFNNNAEAREWYDHCCLLLGARTASRTRG